MQRRVGLFDGRAGHVAVKNRVRNAGDEGVPTAVIVPVLDTVVQGDRNIMPRQHRAAHRAKCEGASTGHTDHVLWHQRHAGQDEDRAKRIDFFELFAPVHRDSLTSDPIGADFEASLVDGEMDVMMRLTLAADPLAHADGAHTFCCTPF